MNDRLEIHIDGACKGNPGKAGIGVVIRSNNNVIKEISKPIGNATNNIAEYTALLCALEESIKLSKKKLKIYTDSELLFNQVIGKYKVKNKNLIELYNKANELAKHFDDIKIKHIPREQNKDADKLASDSFKIKQAKVVAPLFNCSEEESPSSKG